MINITDDIPLTQHISAQPGVFIGLAIVALTTDYVFHDPKAIGSSEALVGTIRGLPAALLFRLSRRPYLDKLDRAEPVQEPL